MYPPARTACKPHAAFWQDDSRQRWTRTGPVFRDLRLVVKLITRRAAGHEREKPQAGERFKQRGRRQQRVLLSLHLARAHVFPRARAGGGRKTRGGVRTRSYFCTRATTWSASRCGRRAASCGKSSLGADASMIRIVRRRTGVEVRARTSSAR
jgi:hypothetical protein